MKTRMAGIIAGCVRLLTGVVAYRSNDAESSDNSLPTVFYANHGSHLDALVIWAAMPDTVRERLRPVAAADYWERSGVRRWLARQLNCVLVPREGISRANSPIAALVDALKDGDSLLIFPQGTRKAAVDAPFKGGLYHICKAMPETQCVPLYLANVSRILPAGEFLPLPLIANLRAGTSVCLEDAESKQDFLQRAHRQLMILMD